MKYSFTDEQLTLLKKILDNMAFEYQRRWSTSQAPVRHITKTRQCGADWYFSLEALIDAAETGRNQNFLTPQGGQMNRALIARFAEMVGVRIQGKNSPIEFSNGAEIKFFNDRSLTFVDATGNAYVSEYAWSANPRRLYLSGRAIAMQKKYRFTAYTSPSKNHDAYNLWVSEKEENKQILSADDACALGCTLLDIPQLKTEFSYADYSLLFSAAWPQEKSQVTA